MKGSGSKGGTPGSSEGSESFSKSSLTDGGSREAPLADPSTEELERRARSAMIAAVAQCGRADLEPEQVLKDVRDDLDPIGEDDEDDDPEPKAVLPDGGTERPGSELGRQADALEDIAEQMRVQNAALVELIRTLDTRAAQDIGIEEPVSGRSGKSVAAWVEDAALDIEERVDLDAIDRAAKRGVR